MDNETTWHAGRRSSATWWTVLLAVALLLTATTSRRAAAEVFWFAFGSEGTAAGEFLDPGGIALDGNGSVYVADGGNVRVQTFDAAGSFLRQFSAGGGAVLTGIAVNGNTVYVSDSANLLVRAFDASGTPLLQIDPECILGVGCIDPDGPGGRPMVFPPDGVAVDAAGDLYLIGTYHLSKFAPTGDVLVEFPLGGIIPKAVAVDHAGNILIYEKDWGSINKYRPDGTLLVRFGDVGCDLGTGFGCVDPDGAGPRELGDGQFGAGPGAIAVDGMNRIYATDPSNGRVQVFDDAGNFLRKFGSPGSGDGQLLLPWGIAVDAAGRVYVVDSGNHRVQVWTGDAAPPPGADLVVTAVSDPPAALLPGARLSVTDTVLNQGGRGAGPSTTRHYLSLGMARTPQSILLKGTRPVGSLAAGASSQGTSTMVTVPISTPEATYYLLACADDVDRVAETNESNNCAPAALPVTVGRPDLVVTAVSDPPALAMKGSRFAVTDSVANQGPLGADPTTTRYYASANSQWGPEDRLLVGTRAVPALAAGASFPVTPTPVTVSIPSNMAAGTYFILACADNTRRVIESSETNNCRASAGQVVVR
jgi:sugar lactone lactonase YvrE